MTHPLNIMFVPNFELNFSFFLRMATKWQNNPALNNM